MRIPKLSSIIDRALDERGDAFNAFDDSTVRQIDALIKSLYQGMKMRWSADGSLIVTSATTVGRAYRVTDRACDCPAFVPCKHMRLRELLIDMLTTEAETADMEAEPDPPIDIPDEGPNPTPGGPPAPEFRALGLRLCVARSLIWQTP